MASHTALRAAAVGTLAASLALAGHPLASSPLALTRNQQPAPPALEGLKPVAALPAHVAGAFQDVTACHQTRDGQYFVFDRRAHSVFTVPPPFDAARKLIEIGTEPGRVLDPTAFDVGPDGTFVVADAPSGQPRVQIFTMSGASLGGFFLHGRAISRIVLGSLVLNGIGTIEYTGKSVFLSHPEGGAVISEYGGKGEALRTFGELRRTGHESDPNVHLALNTGIVRAAPDGTFYFVFLAGVPQFRKYSADGRLVFERHIEGPHLDRFIQTLPTIWNRKTTPDGAIPLVLPSVHAAAVDRAGNLWISLAVGATYVYDSNGERRRAVEFRAPGGPLGATSLTFTPAGRVLVSPGCYAFDAS